MQLKAVDIENYGEPDHVEYWEEERIKRDRCYSDPLSKRMHF